MTSSRIPGVTYGEAEYRIPKTPIAVEIVLDGGRRFAGNIHVAGGACSHGGRERIIDVLDAPEPFLPITDGAGNGHLLVKDRIVMVRIAELEDAGITDPQFPFVTTHVEFGLASLPVDERHLHGTIRINMPPGHVRLLDYLNQAGPFIPLELDEGVTLLVARRYLVYAAQI